MTDENKKYMQDLSSRIIIREARLEDDAQICDLIRRTSMPGSISMTTDFKPSFFSAIEVEGYAYRVAVAETNNQIVGVRPLFKRRIFLNGTSVDFGYIGSVRMDPSFRGKKILAQLIQFMNKWNNEGFCFPYYLFSVIQDYVAAKEIFTSGRLGLPPNECFGILYNAAIPIFKRRLPRLPDGIRVVRGSEVGAVKIAEFLNRTGREKQFFPVYTADDIMADDGILRGLHLDDFYVAIKEDQIVGVTACWNQLPFRRTLITGYPWYLRWLKHLSAPLANILHMEPFPNPGEPLRNVVAACIAVANNNQQIFDLLLNTILHNEYNTGKAFLVVGLMEGDPLLPVLNKYMHIPSRTCIYMASWDGLDVLSKLDGPVPYMELGGL